MSKFRPCNTARNSSLTMRLQTRPLRTPCHRTSAQQQGQARPQAGQEAVGHLRPCEEKGGRDDQGHCGEQEGGSLSGAKLRGGKDGEPGDEAHKCMRRSMASEVERECLCLRGPVTCNFANADQRCL